MTAEAQTRQQGGLAQHAQADSALQAAPADTATAADAKKGLTVLGKLGIFIGFPLTVGVVALYMAYLGKLKGKRDELSFDQDFVFPFLLALAMVTVIGFQTGGYTNREVAPLVAWPKVKRVKKTVYKNKKGEIVQPPDSALKKDN